ALEIGFAYERDPKKKTPTGNVVLSLKNTGKQAVRAVIKDHAYKKNDISRNIEAGGTATLVLSLKDSHSWYDFSVKVDGFHLFEKRFAGRVETGRESISDPYMGKA